MYLKNYFLSGKITFRNTYLGPPHPTQTKLDSPLKIFGFSLFTPFTKYVESGLKKQIFGQMGSFRNTTRVSNETDPDQDPQNVCPDLGLNCLQGYQQTTKFTANEQRVKHSVWSIYGKCSKISKTFLVPSSNKTLVIRAGIHKMANAGQNSKQGRPRSDCFFISSIIWVCTVCLGIFGRQLVFEIIRTFSVHCNLLSCTNG